MNILFVCGTYPGNLKGGDYQRTHLFYESLCQIGKVHVLYADCAKSTRADTAECARRERLKMGLVRRFIDHYVYRAYEWLSPVCPMLLPFPWDNNAARAFPGVKFDVVVARYLFDPAVEWLWRYGPLYVDVDDCPLQKYETMYAAHHGAFRRWITRGVIRLVLKRILSHCEGVWLSNAEQRNWMDGRCRVGIVENIPVAIPPSPDAGLSRGSFLLTVGTMAYEPNFLGVDRFLTQIWPDVRKAYPDLEYRIVGPGLPEDCLRKWRAIPGVRYLGPVDDLSAQYAAALAAVVPVDMGGGTCIKTREALAYARVCLSTEFGARGLDLQNRKAYGLLIYHDAGDFLAGLKDVLDEDWRSDAEKAARRFAEERFSRASFERGVTDLIQRIGGKEQPSAC